MKAPLFTTTQTISGLPEKRKKKITKVLFSPSANELDGGTNETLAAARIP
jgi:hypothetical protein